MVDLIGIDLPRIVGPGFATPALSVSRHWLSLQAPDIYARYRQGELTATQVARFTLLLLFASIFWSNRKEKFNPSILKSLENLAHLAEYDWAGAILSRMYDDMCDLSRGHCKLSGTYYFWEVEVGPMTARLQSWIQVDPHFQRSNALSRRRVVLSNPVLRRYYLGLTHCTWYCASRVLRQMGIDQTVPIIDDISDDSAITPGVTRAVLRAWVRDHPMVRPLPNPADVQTSPEYRT
ncbi:hypothetical protein JCGZ_25306 [Jatropha curcas]|uniref:Aminotransferase-like plant mobile domain-containing protein n=1 Tax=Jatropha curcas TaxID=180498 RepID=A0A067JLR1_JATCU|nr:hypothetical protein JCGZ_25306 [Jatropha curcas]